MNKAVSRTKNTSNKNVSIDAIDLFCGVGGLTHGFARAGIDVKAGIDIDENCRYPYEINNAPSVFIKKDIRDLAPKDVLALVKGSNPVLLAGCAPCQPFSTYSQSGRKNGEHEDWELLKSYGRLIVSTKPELVAMENVPQVVNHPVFDEFLRSLRGYKKKWTIVECASIGVPQTRKRLVLLASRLGDYGLELSNLPSTIVNVKDAISHMPPLIAGGKDINDSMHIACRLNEINLKRIRASKPGGTWRDWPKALRAECHKRETGNSYPSVYGRMSWDAPAPTMTTQCFGYGNGRFGHPEQDRAITLREAAILQTFPQNYVFIKKGERASTTKLGRLIGNAVPVRLGEVIAQTLLEHVRHYS